jgi:hypothetical protein
MPRFDRIVSTAAWLGSLRPIPKLNRGLDILFGAAKDAHGNWEMCGEMFTGETPTLSCVACRRSLCKRNALAFSQLPDF